VYEVKAIEADIDVPEASVKLGEKTLQVFNERRDAWDRRRNKRDAAAQAKAQRLAQAQERERVRRAAVGLKTSATDSYLSQIKNLATSPTGPGLSEGERSAAATTTTPTRTTSPSIGDHEDSLQIAQELAAGERVEAGGEDSLVRGLRMFRGLSE